MIIKDFYRDLEDKLGEGYKVRFSGDFGFQKIYIYRMGDKKFLCWTYKNWDKIAYTFDKRTFYTSDIEMAKILENLGFDTKLYRK